MYNDIYVRHEGIETVYYVNVKTLQFVRSFHMLQKKKKNRTEMNNINVYTDIQYIKIETLTFLISDRLLIYK